MPKGSERYWLCEKCYDVPYGHVLDRRDGNCTRHGEVTEVRLDAIPPKRLMVAAPAAQPQPLGAEGASDVK